MTTRSPADHDPARRILLVEDEMGLVMTLSDRLTNEGYTVEAVHDGLTALERGLNQAYDLIILDVMLPERSGLDVCRDLRHHRVLTPVLMLTARGQLLDKVLGLKIGADDYLAKPFDMLELLARVEALLRRSPGATPLANPVVMQELLQAAETYNFGDVRVALERSEVTRNGKRLDLSALEFRLLRYLITHRNQTISREALLNEVWGYNTMVSTRTVDVHIAWLRQKLEPNPRHPRFILTVHGMGYKFVG